MVWVLQILQFCFLILVIRFIYSVSCDELDDLVAKIENEINKSRNYEHRIDNSDIFSEVLANNSTHYGVFDFIVVGGGSAGAIVAKRLSDSKYQVLLLEAGPVYYELLDIPGLYDLWLNSDFNWGYLSSPQTFICQGMNNKQCPVFRGKVLGGSSSINGMAYARGNSYDQDSWQKYGISGWSWNETLPYFKKFENYHEIYADRGYHGFYGPIHMDYSRPNHLLDNVFFNANAEIYKLTKDYNGEIQMAAGKLQFNKNNGKRESTGEAYLRNYNRKFLKIESKAYVHKILFRNNQTVGVEFIIDNQKNFKAIAKREVIVSAGALNSPQLLMLSGIGPKEELIKHNIPVIADLPVGKNLKDHVYHLGLTFESNLLISNKDKTLREHAFDFLSEVGLLTGIGSNSVSFISTDNNTRYPDIEVIIVASGRQIVQFSADFNMNAETIQTLGANLDQLDKTFKIILVLLHPKSKGAITLKSKSPIDFPLIDFNSLADLNDTDSMFKALKYIWDLMNTNSFKKIEAKLVKQILPACKDFDYDSKDYWICNIRQLSYPAFHSTGTCVMGKKGSSVVDNKLRVHGIKGLRVADLSVAPMANSGHTNALAMMIGEKAAHLIKSDYY